MLEHIQAKIISVPEYARKPDVNLDDVEAKEAFNTFKPLMDSILSYLHNELERSFNDPNLFFLNQEDGFPLRKDITGEYYISDTCYEGDTYNAPDTFNLTIMFHCLANEQASRGDDKDYVSMEMLVSLNRSTGELEYEEEFGNAAI